MLKPNSYKELMNLINPLDLDEIFSFSGINDKDKERYEKRKKCSSQIFNSMERIGDSKDWRNPNPYTDITPIDEFYDILVGCIQDFYWWSHKFVHIYASVYQRVMNILQIDLERENIGKHFKDGY